MSYCDDLPDEDVADADMQAAEDAYLRDLREAEADDESLAH